MLVMITGYNKMRISYLGMTVAGNVCPSEVHGNNQCHKEEH